MTLMHLRDKNLSWATQAAEGAGPAESGPAESGPVGDGTTGRYGIAGASPPDQAGGEQSHPHDTARPGTQGGHSSG